MAADTYQHRVKDWLSRYKRQTLGVPENGVWLQNGQPYSHILPIAKRKLNILASFRDEFWTWFNHQAIELHRDFHHLNSSQALCFNLFYPLLCNSGRFMPALISVLGLKDYAEGQPQFEYEPCIIEGTHFDFAVPLQSGSWVYFEVKYTESGFGAVKSDDRHLEKFEQVYRPRLRGRFDERFCEATYFFKHYQILRNIWHLDIQKQDVVVFLFPKANQLLRREEPLIRSCAVEPFRSQIRIVYVEDLISELELKLDAVSSSQKVGMAQFRAKYFLGDETA